MMRRHLPIYFDFLEEIYQTPAKLLVGRTGSRRGIPQNEDRGDSPGDRIKSYRNSESLGRRPGTQVQEPQDPGFIHAPGRSPRPYDHFPEGQFRKFRVLGTRATPHQVRAKGSYQIMLQVPLTPETHSNVFPHWHTTGGSSHLVGSLHLTYGGSR